MICASGELYYAVIAVDSKLELRFCGVPLLELVNSTIWYWAYLEHCLFLPWILELNRCFSFVLGHLKFWKKKPAGIEFAKHFRSHLSPIEGLAVSAHILKFIFSIQRGCFIHVTLYYDAQSIIWIASLS
jgi:hypothetical protein